MAYEKYEWHKGEIITADKLNNMENRIEEAASSGGGGERFIIECTLDEKNSTNEIMVYTHNVTLQEAYEAFESGKEIYAKINRRSEILYVNLNNVDYSDNLIMFIGALHNPTDNNILFTFAFSNDNKIFMLKSSAPEPIIFNIAVDSASVDVKSVTCNYFYGQIKEMSQNPTMPLTATAIMINDDGIVSTRSGYSIDVYPEDNYITFSRIAYSGINLMNYIITYNSDGSITFSSSTIVTNENGGR